MEAKKTIYETIEEWLKEQYDSDLMEFAKSELCRKDTPDWLWHIETDEYFFMRAECCLGHDEHDTFSKVCSIIKDALAMSNEVKYLDANGDEWDEDEVRKSIKEDHLDELVDKVMYDMGTYGIPEDYADLDTGELLTMLVECPEWVDEYGPDWEEEYGPKWKKELLS